MDSKEDSLMSWSRYVLPPVLAFITAVTIFGNLFVLVDFFTRLWKTPNRVSPTHFFIANLAVADFLVGLVVLPFLGVVQVSGEWSFGKEWCTGWTFIHFWLCATSILSTCFVCVDRYVGVRFPFEHVEIFGGWRIWGVLLGVWALAGTPAGLRVFMWSDEKTRPQDWATCNLRQSVEVTVMACVIVLYIPATVMAVLYTKIYGIAKEHMKKRKEMKASGENESSTAAVSFSSSCELTRKASAVSIAISESSKGGNEEEGRSVKKQLTLEERQVRLAKRLFFLVGVLVVSYFPYFTLILVRAVYPDFVSGKVFQGFAWLRYFNSCINPFIYAYAVPSYRQSLRRSVSKVTKKWDKREIQIPPHGMSSLK